MFKRWEAFTPTLVSKTFTLFAHRKNQAHHILKVLFYFAQSPFFDAMSNNNVIYTQAMNNQSLFYTITTRTMFEERLQAMQGLEFMVVQDPSEGDKKPEHSGVWVISKQNRRKRLGAQDEIKRISTYYIVGENIYMAPSLGSVMSCRLVGLPFY